MSVEDLEQYVNQQFDELNRLVRLEEWRVLHLVDLKEAFLTAQAAEKISEISVHTEKLQEEMDSVTQQLSELDQIEQNGVAPMSLAPLLAARPPRPPEALVEPMPLVSPFCTLFQSSFTERKKKSNQILLSKGTFHSRYTFPGNQTHNLGIARAMLHCLSYRNASTSHILVRETLVTKGY